MEILPWGQAWQLLEAEGRLGMLGRGADVDIGGLDGGLGRDLAGANAGWGKWGPAA